MVGNLSETIIKTENHEDRPVFVLKALGRVSYFQDCPKYPKYIFYHHGMWMMGPNIARAPYAAAVKSGAFSPVAVKDSEIWHTVVAVQPDWSVFKLSEADLDMTLKCWNPPTFAPTHRVGPTFAPTATPTGLPTPRPKVHQWVHLTGLKEGRDSRAGCAGWYEHTGAWPPHSSTVARPMYTFQNAAGECGTLGGEVFMYFYPEKKMWVVNSVVGMPPFWFVSLSTSFTPDSVGAPWKVLNSQGAYHVDAPLKVLGLESKPPTPAPTRPIEMVRVHGITVPKAELDKEKYVADKVKHMSKAERNAWAMDQYRKHQGFRPTFFPTTAPTTSQPTVSPTTTPTDFSPIRVVVKATVSLPSETIQNFSPNRYKFVEALSKSIMAAKVDTKIINWAWWNGINVNIEMDMRENECNVYHFMAGMSQKDVCTDTGYFQRTLTSAAFIARVESYLKSAGIMHKGITISDVTEKLIADNKHGIFRSRIKKIMHIQKSTVPNRKGAELKREAQKISTGPGHWWKKNNGTRTAH